MTPNTITVSKSCPEGTVHCRFVEDQLGDDPAPTVLINIGKAGSRLNALADWGARLLGAALRAGTDPRRLANITADITHVSSNGHYDAKSVADAVAQALWTYAEQREALYISADPDPRTLDDGDESAEAVLGHA